MQTIAGLRAELAAAEQDARDAEWCDDVTATMPGGVLSRAWARVHRCHADLALAEEMQRLMPRTPAALIAEIERTRKEAAS
ncbi:MAG: hypothetical protein KAX84_09700 [Burkholderiales bacterium]|nr:hypothetical protein [Burkholderiales bacterium]